MYIITFPTASVACCAEPVLREPGETWMIRGPMTYIPTIEVEIVAKRASIALSSNEGIYVRNKRTGRVRAEMGAQAYLLNEHEELWEKELEPLVETLLL